ncbi:hypothetical protein [Brevundimonas sp. DC300-4]|uniref:hypothetical protein n=1 Tax=Brevundimonas sp. DC300-4 TaxID=2804594 RepID=UPI003CEE1955
MNPCENHSNLTALTVDQAFDDRLAKWWGQHSVRSLMDGAAHQQHGARENGEFGETAQLTDLNQRFQVAHEVQP